MVNIPAPIGASPLSHYAHHSADLKAGVSHSFDTGELHVFRVRRVVKGSDADGLTVTVLGSPASHSTKATNALITFVPDADARMEPLLDTSSGRVRLYYPKAEYDEVMKVLRHKGARLCYFWRSSDQLRSLAWLITLA